jgi:hypothetical protein
MSVPIPPIGIHRLSDKDYFAIDLPSSSSTKVLASHPNATLAWERENPREESDDFAVGAYVHACLLDPESIPSNFIMVGEINKRTKEGKAEWESLQRRAERNGARLLMREQRELGDAMAVSAQANPSVRTLLASACEREIAVIGEIGGRPAKAKLDAVLDIQTEDGPVTCIVDLKTTKSADPRQFAKDAAAYGYFHQAAFYTRLLRQHRRAVEDYVVIAVEKTPPYLCAVYRIPSVAIAVADEKVAALVERWWSVKDGDRTGYPQGIVELEPPRWWLIGE